MKYIKLFEGFESDLQEFCDTHLAYLLDDGFIMMQYSVYSRICKNNDDLNKHINRLKINAPKTGNIRLLQVTENQYNNIIMFSGTKKVEEDISIESLLVFE